MWSFRGQECLSAPGNTRQHCAAKYNTIQHTSKLVGKFFTSKSGKTVIYHELEYLHFAARSTGLSARLAPLAAKRSLRSLCYWNINLWAIVQIPLPLQISRTRCKHPTPAANIPLSLQTSRYRCKHPAIAANFPPLLGTLFFVIRAQTQNTSFKIDLLYTHLKSVNRAVNNTNGLRW